MNEFAVPVRKSLCSPAIALAVAGVLAGRAAATTPATAPSQTPDAADVALDHGDLAKALEQLKAQHAARPNDARVLVRTAFVQERLDASEAAETSLAAALAVGVDPADVAAVQLRRATLAFDANRPADALTCLRAAAAVDTAASARAGVVAYLYGQYAAAAELLHAASPAVSTRLLEGNAALKAGLDGAAADAFGRAADLAKKPADRLFAQERLVAAARQAGTLGRLVDGWLADKQLPAQRLTPLVTLLRELNRTDDLLTWWKTASADPARAANVQGDRLINEVIGAARAAGRTADVVDICQNLLARDPGDVHWLTATVRALLAAERPTEADARLSARLDAVRQDPAAIERLGKLARSLGRDDVAVDTARRLMAFKGTAAVAGDLLEASVRQQAGDAKAAEALLKHAAGVARLHPAAAGPVVNALEAADLAPEAVELLQVVAAKSADEETDARLASLLFKLRRPAEAGPLLRRMMRSGSTAAVRGQAAQRLLDTAAANDTLPAMIADLRARLATPAGTPEDLSLLVDACLRTNDTAGAAAALTASRLIDEPARLNRLAVLHLRAKQYDQADAVLRRLLDADPAGATGTLERIASAALNGGRNEDAAAAIDRLERRLGDGTTAGEMMAAVLDRLGRPADAAAGYRRALAVDPDNADNWLLWSTAMNKSGQSQAARRRLLVLCGQTPNDAVFAAATDALLNLATPGPALRVARRDAVLRAAERPNKVMLLHVIADLSDELQDADMLVRATDTGVAVSDEERGQRLRELMDVANQKGKIDVAIDSGRTLLALGDDFPPDLFLQLGEQLLIDGRTGEADRAFTRAAETGDPTSIATRAADLYERYGYFELALASLKPNADRMRSNGPFREHLGRLNEIVGRYDAAFENHLAAAAVRIRESAAEDLPEAGATAPAGQAGPPTTSVQTVSVTTDVGRNVGAAIFNARTPAQQTALLDLLSKAIADILAAPGDRPPGRLGLLSTALDRAGFAFVRPEVADDANARIIARWPAAADLVRQAVDFRVANGLIERADAFGDAHGFGSRSRREPPSTAPATAEAVADELATLLSRGETETARRLLAGVAPQTGVARPGGAGGPSAYTKLVAGAIAVGDEETALDWSLCWLDDAFGTPKAPATTRPTERRVRLGGPGDAVDQCRSAFGAAWPWLSAPRRQRLLERLAAGVGRVEDDNSRAVLSLYALQAAAALPVRLPNTSALADDALSVRLIDPLLTPARVVLLVPPQDRPAVLRRALAAVGPSEQLALLTGLADQAAGPFDSTLSEAVIAAANNLAGKQTVTWGNWYCNAAHKAEAAALAEAAVRCGDGDASSLAVAAAALANAGHAVRADDIARRAADEFLKPLPPVDPNAPRQPFRAQPSPAGVLRVIVASLSPAAKAELLATTPNRVLRAQLLDDAGRRDEALAAVRDNAARDPSDRASAMAYLDRLRDDGRNAEIVGVLMPQVAGGASVDARRQLALSDALTDLYQWRRVRSSVGIISSPVDMATPLAGGEADGVSTAFRALLQGVRSPRPMTQFPDLPGPHGFTPPMDALAGDTPAPLSRFVEWPGAFDDLLGTLDVLPETSGLKIFEESLAWVPKLLAGAAARPEDRDALLARLSAAAAKQALTGPRRKLVVALARVPGCRVPPGLLAALWPAALADRTGVELKRLADALAAQQVPGTGPVRRYADVIAAASRAGAARETAGIEFSPMGNPNDSSVARWLNAAGDAEPVGTETRASAYRVSGLTNAAGRHTQMAWARLAAARGDVEAFAGRVDAFLDQWAWERTGPVVGMMNDRAGDVPDLTEALPDAPDAAVRPRLLAAVQASLLRLAGRWPSNTDVPRNLAAIGKWAADRAEPLAAEELLAAARRVGERQGPGEQQLWAADLARRLGKPDVAVGIERALLEARCLPSARIVPLLKALRPTADAATLRRLAEDATAYCRSPALLAFSAGLAGPH